MALALLFLTTFYIKRNNLVLILYLSHNFNNPLTKMLKEHPVILINLFIVS